MESATRHATRTPHALEEMAHSSSLSVITLVDKLITEAHEQRASDIHIDPTADGLVVRLRIDGMLQDKFFFDKRLHGEIITRIKIMSALRTDEHQAAQDGRFRIQIEGGTAIDVRVSITPTYYGENGVLRLLTDHAEEFTLETLGFSPENQKKIEQAIRKPHGMILATGPTGSGKTTTLYTLLKQLNEKTVSIITIEDPVEYAVTGITQIQINPRAGLTFGSGLRSILRQDPNIIMVGEIRDAETASIAVNTALTGHLILSTLHTNDSATTLPRLLDMGVDPYLVASTVNVAIGQRLVRKICEQCREGYTLSEGEQASLNGVLLPGQLNAEQTFYRGKGCEACDGSGYAGRLGIHEVMVIDPELREAILKKASAANLKEIAKKNGMITMFADGFMKAEAGKTTIEEVLRTVNE
jgi:type II secretory ATPase GspE/PulE/Tfp pilus assembly ATPase PilB-like protein